MWEKQGRRGKGSPVFSCTLVDFMCCYPFACDNGPSMSSPPSLNVTPDRTAERAGNVVCRDWWILAEGERCEKHTEMSAARITGAWCSFKSQQMRSVEGPVFNDGTGLESYAAAWWVITSLNNIIPIICLSSWPLIPSPPCLYCSISPPISCG